jgi:hypothetical protein
MKLCKTESEKAETRNRFKANRIRNAESQSNAQSPKSSEFSELFGSFRSFSEGHSLKLKIKSEKCKMQPRRPTSPRLRRTGQLPGIGSGRRGAVSYCSLQFPAFPWFSLVFPDYEKEKMARSVQSGFPKPAANGFPNQYSSLLRNAAKSKRVEGRVAVVPPWRGTHPGGGTPPELTAGTGCATDSPTLPGRSWSVVPGRA